MSTLKLGDARWSITREGHSLESQTWCSLNCDASSEASFTQNSACTHTCVASAVQLSSPSSSSTRGTARSCRQVGSTTPRKKMSRPALRRTALAGVKGWQ